MADKDISIGIKTVGADAAVAEVNKISSAMVSMRSAPVLGSASSDANDRAIRAVQSVTDKAKVAQIAYYNLGEALDRDFKKILSGSKSAEFAFSDLGKEIKKTSATSETFTKETGKVSGASSNASRSLLMFSQGFEDAQYGMRGVLNNIPGLVMSLGGTAGIAGAVSIAAVSFSVLYDWFSKTEEKASDVEERITKTAESMGKMEVDRFTRMAEEIDGARDSAESLKQTFEETQKAEAAFSTAALSNAAKIEQAELNIETALGYQVDRYKELQYLAEVESAKRREAANQAIEEEKQKLRKAEELATAAADKLSQTILQAAEEKGNLVNLQGQLEALRQQKAELEKIAAFKRDKNFSFGEIGPSLEDVNRGVAAGKANATLESPLFKAQLAGTEKRVDELEQLVSKLDADGTGAVDKAQNALNAATKKVEDVRRAVDINITRLEETAAADDLLARSQTLVESQKVTAEDMKAAIAGIETYNETSKAAKDVIAAKVEDGVIAANETQTVAQNLSILLGQINIGNASSKESLQQMIMLQSRLIEEQAKNKSEINALYKRMDAIQGEIRRK
jgi:hypothetical protein